MTGKTIRPAVSIQTLARSAKALVSERNTPSARNGLSSGTVTRRKRRHARDGRVGDGGGSRPPELGVSELPAIVLQPDERRGSGLQRREAGEARPDLPAKGVGQHGEKQEDGRGQEEIGGPEFALPPCPPSDHR